MDLGAFSISLAVKDLEASRQFYEKFGFTVFAGDPSQNWLILKMGTRFWSISTSELAAPHTIRRGEVEAGGDR